MLPGWPGDEHSYSYCQRQGVLSPRLTQPAVRRGCGEGGREPSKLPGRRERHSPLPRKAEARFLRKTSHLAPVASVRSPTSLRGTPDRRQEEPESQRPPGMSPFMGCPPAPRELWLKGKVSWLTRLFRSLGNEARCAQLGGRVGGPGLGLRAHVPTFPLAADSLEQTSRSLSVCVCSTGQ